MRINARVSKRRVESGAIRTPTALHLLRFTNVPTFAFRISANSCCCCYPRRCVVHPSRKCGFPASNFRTESAAKCTMCRCVTYIGRLSRKRLISNLPACRGSILGDPDIQKPSPLPPLHHHRLHLRLHLRCLPPPLCQFIHASTSPHPRPSGPIQLPLVTPVVVFSATFSPTRRRADRASPLSSLVVLSRRVPPTPAPPPSYPSIHFLPSRGIEIPRGRRRRPVVRPFDVPIRDPRETDGTPRMIRSSLD